jgi:broad specificity phosphatase PhoE
VTPAPKTLLRLYLVRHGQTEWSLSGQHTGRTDIPLTAHGEAEARELMPWLKQVQFGLALTSPRQRARRSCELAGLGREAEIEPDRAEWDLRRLRKQALLGYGRNRRNRSKCSQPGYVLSPRED